MKNSQNPLYLKGKWKIWKREEEKRMGFKKGKRAERGRVKNPRTENGKEKKIRKFRKREKGKKGKQRGNLDLEDV